MDDDRRGLDGGSLLWPNSNAGAGMQIQKTYPRKSTGKMLKVLFLGYFGYFLMISDGCVADTSAMLELFTGGGKSSNGEVHSPGARRQFRSMNIEALGSGTWWIVW